MTHENATNAATANGFAHLYQVLTHRTFAPVSQVTFWVYLLLGVVLFGGLGFWYEFGKYLYAASNKSLDGLLIALLTFFPALVGSSALQLIFSDANTKPMKAFSLLCLAVFLLVFGWLAFGRPSNIWVSISAAGAGSLAAIWIWWIANGLDPAFQDQLPVNAALGGDTNASPPGDLTGFKH